MYLATPTTYHFAIYNSQPFFVNYTGLYILTIQGNTNGIDSAFFIDKFRVIPVNYTYNVGSDCSLITWNCFGASSLLSATCNGQGSCINMDICVCNRREYRICCYTYSISSGIQKLPTIISFLCREPRCQISSRYMRPW